MQRYAAFVFDRDDGRLRILDDVGDLFGPIGIHAHFTRTNPASPTNGLDWIVQVAWAPLESGTGEMRQLVVSPDVSSGPTPFTVAEMKVLGDPRCRRNELETRHFVKASPSQIKELWKQVPPKH